jgi:hypothetical protein
VKPLERPAKGENVYAILFGERFSDKHVLLLFRLLISLEGRLAMT